MSKINKDQDKHILSMLTAAMLKWIRMQDVGYSNPSRDRHKSVVTAPLSNARQHVRVSWIFGYEQYKVMPSITVDVAR